MWVSVCVRDWRCGQLWKGIDMETQPHSQPLGMFSVTVNIKAVNRESQGSRSLRAKPQKKSFNGFGQLPRKPISCKSQFAVKTTWFWTSDQCFGLLYFWHVTVSAIHGNMNAKNRITLHLKRSVYIVGVFGVSKFACSFEYLLSRILAPTKPKSRVQEFERFFVTWP